MKRILLSIASAAILLAPGSFAQETSANPPRFTEERLKQTEQSLVNALESDSPGMQASAAATIRQLEALLPNESFSCFVIPLMRIVKNEGADVPVRVLAALALDELNSSIGDYAIKGVAKFSDCKRMHQLCTALTLKRVQDIQLANAKKQEESKSIAKQ